MKTFTEIVLYAFVIGTSELQFLILPPAKASVRFVLLPHITIKWDTQDIENQELYINVL